jgi:hypothetical protein
MTELIQQAISALETQRATAARQVETCDQALAALRIVVGGAPVPAKPSPAPAAARRRPAKPRGQAPKASEVAAPPDELSVRILKAIEKEPQSTGQLEAAFGVSRKLTSALIALVEARKVHRIGTGPRNYRWSLKGSSPVPDVAPSPKAIPPVTAAAPGPKDAHRDEAIAKARRFGHVLGPFKPSSPGAGSAHIARCTACDTYVTIGRDGSISGPGTRHDCLAAKG